MDPRNALLLALVLVCALTDLYVSRVFDWTTWPAAVAGLALNGLHPNGVGAASSLGGFCLGFGVLYTLFLTGRMGGGDVKLMGAIGAVKGVAFVYAVLVYSFLVGGLLSVLYLVWRPAPPQGEAAATPVIPFGAAISAAALWALSEELLRRPLVDWLV